MYIMKFKSLLEIIITPTPHTRRILNRVLSSLSIFFPGTYPINKLLVTKEFILKLIYEKNIPKKKNAVELPRNK